MTTMLELEDGSLVPMTAVAIRAGPGAPFLVGHEQEFKDRG